MSESPQENSQPEAESAPEAGQQAAAEPAVEAAAEPVAERKRGGGGRLLGLALLLLVIIAGWFGWQWYEGRLESNAMRQELAQKLADADAKALADRRAAEQAREAISAVQEKLDALESRLGETEAQQATLESLTRELSRNRDDWTVTEIEQALVIANQRLKLSGDVTAALRALRTAQEKLRPLAQPELNALREAINSDIARLQKLPIVDTVGISAQLDDLLARVDKLPLAMDVRPRPSVRSDAGGTEDPLWKRLLRETWEELKQLVRIQRMDRPDIALLTPSQTFFLRENLKLRLLSARLALFARDARSYKADLGAAVDWLRQYYDVRNDAVDRAVKMLSSLREMEVSSEVPDISASLEAMRNYRRGPTAKKP